MIEWPLSVFMLALILIQEVWGSGQSLSKVSKRFWLLSIKSKTPSLTFSALLFATLAFMCFAFWESILRVLLQAQLGLWLSLLGAAILFSVLAIRSRKYLRERDTAPWSMNALEWVGVVLGFSLMIHAWIVTVLLGGWVYWRSLKALPTTR